jgi:hypothetical protein
MLEKLISVVAGHNFLAEKAGNTGKHIDSEDEI